MIDVLLTLKIDSHLLLLTDAYLMIAATLSMNAVHYQRRFTSATPHTKTFPRKLSRKGRGILVQLRR
jgi:hypothetical protein